MMRHLEQVAGIATFLTLPVTAASHELDGVVHAHADLAFAAMPMVALLLIVWRIRTRRD